MRNTPILPLDLWREILGFHPWHFWGIYDATNFPITSACNTIVYEYGWQGADQAGRMDIRQAIITAEQILCDQLGYWPAPVYTESMHPWPRYNNQSQYRLSRVDVRGGWIPVQVDTGHVQVCGVEGLTLIQAGAVITYMDYAFDGTFDTAVITVPTTVTDPSEIAVYFTAADRIQTDNALSDRWRIEPAIVTISAGTATIKIRRWLCVYPNLYEVKANYPFNAIDPAKFILKVDVYRRYTNMIGVDSNTDSQSAIIWESRPCNCGCGSSILNSTDPASEGWVAGRAGVRDSYNGYVTPAEATYDAVNLQWVHPCNCLDTCGEPDKVLIRYLAGLPLDSHGWMQNWMRTTVARLATAEMTRRICACDNANREFSNWQLDVSRTNSVETYSVSPELLSNPLGTRRGHLYAWQQIKNLARVTGVLI
jgi:hypothetical protein